MRSPTLFRHLHRNSRRHNTIACSEWSAVRVSSQTDVIDMALCDDGHVLGRNAPDLSESILDALDEQRPLMFPKQRVKLITITPARISALGTLVAACVALVVYTRFGPTSFELRQHISAPLTSNQSASKALQSSPPSRREAERPTGTPKPTSFAGLSAASSMDNLTAIDINDPRSDNSIRTLAGSGDTTAIASAIAGISLEQLVAQISPLPTDQQVVILEAWMVSVSLQQRLPSPIDANVGAVQIFYCEQ